VAFEGLTDRLQDVFRRLRGHGKIREDDVKAAMREVRMALLEADVNYKVVKTFVATVGERAVGQEVLSSITPGQQIIKIVYDEMTQLMGGAESKLTWSSRPPSVYLMVGLQGAGKTTMSAKLALMYQKQGKKPLLVACDVYRPAAVKQLQVLGEQIGVPVYTSGDEPVAIAAAAWEYARNEHFDPLIIDTAGRLHIDEKLMQELTRIREQVRPHETLLVVDAMTGQDAVNVAENFHSTLGLTGVVLTKLDGDSRGGAALSVKAVTGCPIKLTGMGEKLDDLEIFYPERMASRILGMGDIVSLVEKAQASFDGKMAEEMERKLRDQDFDLDDFLQQMQQLRKIGKMEDLLGMIPGLGAKMKDVRGQIDDRDIDRLGAIIQSMTMQERKHPTLINGSRKKRIAAGSGARVQDVNRLLKQFGETKKMMKKFTDMGGKGKRGFPKGLQLPF
jgi:signal recognition particle subunit SRP54